MPPRKKTSASKITTVLTSIEEGKSIKDTSQSTNLEQLRSQVTQQINAIFDLLIKEINAVSELKKRSQEELALKERQNRQHEDEQSFNFLMAQRKKQAEFDEKLAHEKKMFEEMVRQKEEKLQLLKEDIDKREKELNDLKMQAEAFPQKLEKTLEETGRQLTAELKKDFDNERKLITQKYESDLKLRDQQISSLQTAIKQQEKEIASLRQEKTKAQDQMKEIAIAVVSSKETHLQTQTS